MARNLLPPSANPPNDPQSDQDEAESDEVESGQSERTASQLRAMKSGSDDDSGSSLSSPSASAFILKQNPNSKKKKRDATAAVETHESEVKKKKQKKNGIGAIATVVEDKVKKSTGRLWSPEDELIILEKMLDYKQETGVDASSNLKAFHSYIKDSLNAIADKSQLSSKIKKLREKYHANARKEANGEELLLSFKDHEAKVYEHSKKIWGHKVARGSQSVKIKPKTVNVVVPCSSVAETDSVLALPVPELEVSSKVVNGSGSPKVSNWVPKVARKMDLDDDDHEKKDSSVGSAKVSSRVRKVDLDDAGHEKKDSSVGDAEISSRVPKVARKMDLDDGGHEKKDSGVGEAKISSRVPKVARKMDLDDANHEKKDSNISMPVLLDSVIIEKGLELVERSKLDALNEKWTKYQLDAAELYLRRLDLVLEQTRLILNAQKSNP